MCPTNHYQELPEDLKQRLDEHFDRETMTAEEAVREVGRDQKVELFRLRKDKFRSPSRL